MVREQGEHYEIRSMTGKTVYGDYEKPGTMEELMRTSLSNDSHMPRLIVKVTSEKVCTDSGRFVSRTHRAEAIGYLEDGEITLMSGEDGPQKILQDKNKEQAHS